MISADRAAASGPRDGGSSRPAPSATVRRSCPTGSGCRFSIVSSIGRSPVAPRSVWPAQAGRPVGRRELGHRLRRCTAASGCCGGGLRSGAAAGASAGSSARGRRACRCPAARRSRPCSPSDAELVAQVVAVAVEVLRRARQPDEVVREVLPDGSAGGVRAVGHLRLERSGRRASSGSRSAAWSRGTARRAGRPRSAGRAARSRARVDRASSRRPGATSRPSSRTIASAAAERARRDRAARASAGARCARRPAARASTLRIAAGSPARRRSPRRSSRPARGRAPGTACAVVARLSTSSPSRPGSLVQRPRDPVRRARRASDRSSASRAAASACGDPRGVAQQRPQLGRERLQPLGAAVVEARAPSCRASSRRLSRAGRVERAQQLVELHRDARSAAAGSCRRRPARARSGCPGAARP